MEKQFDRVSAKEAHRQHEDDFIRNFFKDRNVDNVLDIPVGTGRFFRHYTGVSELTGVDSSGEALEEARRNLVLLPSSVKANLEYGDVFDLRFEDRAFDVAVVFGLSHLLPPPSLSRAIDELCRVTSESVIIQTFAPVRNWQTRLAKFKSWIWNAGAPQESFEYDQESIDSLFNECGFTRFFSLVLDTFGHTEVRGTVYSKR